MALRGHFIIYIYYSSDMRGRGRGGRGRGGRSLAQVLVNDNYEDLGIENTPITNEANKNYL